MQSRRPKPILFSRRTFLRKGRTLTLLLAAGAPGWLCRGAGKLSISEAFDRTMRDFMRVRKVPGGALAVVKDERLVYMGGYGWADREGKEPVKPESLFRIASVSKPFTAAASLKLAQQGAVRLGDG